MHRAKKSGQGAEATCPLELLLPKAGILHHATHAHRSSRRHPGSATTTFFLRNLNDKRLGGKEKASHACGILHRGPSNLRRIKNTALYKVGVLKLCGIKTV